VTIQRLKRLLGRGLRQYVAEYEVSPDQADYGSSDLAALFKNHRGRIAHKWCHYFDFYDRHFSRFRGTPVRMLEIGVALGGSLEVWREYFGPAATIFGIDVNPACAERVDAPNQVRIGSQADPAFLRRVVEEMGGVDIALDDGSHFAGHQRASLAVLFPLLASGGIYAIEDMHTSYWGGEWQGGYRRKGTATETVKSMIDDMHGWWHERPEAVVRKEGVLGIHIYDSIAFIEKGVKARPQVVRLGANQPVGN
jgi:hypothetical protein